MRATIAILYYHLYNSKSFVLFFSLDRITSGKAFDVYYWTNTKPPSRHGILFFWCIKEGTKLFNGDRKLPIVIFACSVFALMMIDIIYVLVCVLLACYFLFVSIVHLYIRAFAMN